MKKTKLSSKFWLALTIFSLVGQVAWVVENMYFNVFIYKMFNASAEQISMMVSASAISATLTTILIGALSDKLGKRKLFICSGYILWGISIWSFSLIRTEIINKLFPMTISAASIGVSLVIIMDCVMTFFGSAANDACFNAWLTIGSLFMMSGYLMGMAVFGAMLRDYTPQNRAGMFQGLRIVGQVLIPGIVGPWIGAMVLRNAEQVLNDDGTYSFIPNANIFLAAFVAACIISLILAVIFKLTKKAKED